MKIVPWMARLSTCLSKVVNMRASLLVGELRGLSMIWLICYVKMSSHFQSYVAEVAGEEIDL